MFNADAIIPPNILEFLRQGLTVWPRLALNLRFSCIGLLGAGIIGM
jgi:hypothetical protein